MTLNPLIIFHGQSWGHLLSCPMLESSVGALSVRISNITMYVVCLLSLPLDVDQVQVHLGA
jgi:hypothetical protein